MSMDATTAVRWRAGLMAAVLIAGGGGYWLGQRGGSGTETGSGQTERKVLYWYDPMVPAEHYDNPNSLSSMGMKTQPKYADDGAAAGATPEVTIDPAAMQNLGIRVVPAKVGSLAGALNVTGSIDFNQRDVAIVQARSGGFVARVYARAPGDVIRAGAPIADVQLPEWGGAQTEFLAVKRLGRPDLTAAARQRLKLLGMSDGLIASVERSGRTNSTISITSPMSGVIQTLDVRVGMTLTQGQTLAQVTGIGTVWLNAAVPEAQAGLVRVGQSASATLTAFPGEAFGGRIIAILPAAQTDSRTITARIELANRGGRLRPGMFAQVALGGTGSTALLVPSEAVIRTGTRTIVMLAIGNGRYQPAEVRTGREGGGQTEILEGLAVGEKVVASGQFLLDSEASLTGIPARKLGATK
ncbi:Cu(I)/Ag(I) efflux system membrane fusion protein [Novosphingobium kunmingense]|uniref:Cu(I)/Ag(I) efflux system membrane fusion protein n=1 Tax=Novosphingobium kunmingense TaxID=1211806 RepID=A0A2N0H7K3_9SPHN|nr:efflux RND transporter periplasmic adaptor subunit [Novosphingobium kunmingense]PKB14926.1 Cu(I)/Ag(I) efflux system membrane fusion protein [Novosphingobium kunmingense]